MKKLSSSEIRKLWLSFFQEKKHFLVPSASLIPINDESLLWINSGVATLKKYFDGSEKPPASRLTNSQKSIRTGDIENVGKTARHHTMFEMLGNFSIGDYFKEEAIEFGYELLTSEKWFNFSMEKLYFTVFEEDQKAYDKWKSLGVPENKIFKMGRNTNFWDVGQGPCGPSTEIFYDKGEKFDSRTAKELIESNLENDRFIEIWNIVFSEFNNDGKGNYTELPQKNIDTGAGLERIVSVFQDTPTNFETDLFKPLINEILSLTEKEYLWNYVPSVLKEENFEQFDINSKVKAIADFSRAVTFAISDGALPGPNGRGYVLRRLIRKSHIYAKGLNINEEFIYKLVPIVAESIQDYYPEVYKKVNTIQEIIKKEEQQFLKTIKQSMKNFDKYVSENALTSQNVFKLYETYGLPLDLVYDLAEQHGININKDEVNDLMRKFQDLAKTNQKVVPGMEQQINLFRDIDETKFIGYTDNESESEIIAVEDEFIALDKTPFYATSGGQEFDRGVINNIAVVAVQKNGNGVFIHEAPGHSFKVGDKVKTSIDTDRRSKITSNHSATHLLFSALEQVWGTSIPQVGSKVEEDFLRFDFIFQGEIKEDIFKAQDIANRWVNESTDVEIFETSLTEAKELGAAYLEGTKYGDIVRVVKMNKDVIDLCGGTHVKNTKDIESILITGWEKKGSGVFRLEAVSGKKQTAKKLVELNTNYLETKLENIIAKLKDVQIKSSSVDLDLSKVEAVEKQFDELDKTLINYKKELNSLIENFNNEIKEINQTFETNISNKLSELIKEGTQYSFFNADDLNIKEINSVAISLMKEAINKIIIISSKDIKKGKGTVAFIISKNLISDELVENIKTITFNNEMKGNGKDQLYVFGGKDDSVDSVLGEVAKWES